MTEIASYEKTGGDERENIERYRDSRRMSIALPRSIRAKKARQFASYYEACTGRRLSRH